ncbi:hypothetical protein [Streptomyces sp. NPDC088812]|uniref:hypothetical protein n=1 Tax=Streptomyces sp. NPDC088812 TaxID=3365905 RepID=UPI00381501CE
MLALTGYVVLGGSDDGGSDAAGKGGATASASNSATASPVPDYTEPGDWTEPERWVALPQGERTDTYGSEVGFPHTTEGAVSLLVTSTNGSVEPGHSTVDVQMRLYRSYMSADDRSDENVEKIEKGAQETDKKLHQQMGVSADSELPSGSYVRTTVIGFKVIQAADDEVSTWMLAKVVTKKGELEKETAEYIRVLMAARWETEDWKLSTQASVQASQQVGSDKPGMAVPGDEKFNEYGWTAIREAS